MKKESLFKKSLFLLIPILIYYAITMVVSMIVGFLIMLKMITTEKVSLNNFTDENYEMFASLVEENTMQMMLLVSVIAIPIFLILMYRDKKKIKMQAIDTRLIVYPLVVIVGISACIFLNLMIGMMDIAQIDTEGADTLEKLYQGNMLLNVIVGVFVIPTTEELLFRGILYKRMRTFMLPKVAIVANGILFGLFHGNLLQFIFSCAIGMLLAYVYEKSRNCWLPIILHASSNGISYLVTYRDEVGQLIFGTLEGVVTAFFVSGAILLISISLLMKAFKPKKQDGGNYETTNNRSAML